MTIEWGRNNVTKWHMAEGGGQPKCYVSLKLNFTTKSLPSVKRILSRHTAIAAGGTRHCYQMSNGRGEGSPKISQKLSPIICMTPKDIKVAHERHTFSWESSGSFLIVLIRRRNLRENSMNNKSCHNQKKEFKGAINFCWW